MLQLYPLGILLWELFSLADDPYAGQQYCEEFVIQIKRGYRMDKPKFSTSEIYEIMMKCWSLAPETRPLFDEMEKNFKTFLHEAVKNVKIFWKICS